MKVPDYSLSLSFGTTVTQEKEERGAQLCPTPCDPMDCGPLGSSVHGIFSGKNAGVGCHFLLQGIFPTQGSNLCLLLCLLHWQAGSLPPAVPGKPLSHLPIKYQIALDEEAPCSYMSLAWFSVFFTWLNFFQSIWCMPYAASGACLAASWNIGPVRTKSLFRSCSVAGVQRWHMDTWPGS